MSATTQENTIRVLVTGFGPFLDIAVNPSWEIARQLPRTLTSPNGTQVEIVVPDEPIPVAYHKVFDQTPKLIQAHNPQIVIHMGLARNRTHFAVEQSALKDGYHDIPDVDRKVFTRAENKQNLGKCPDSLPSTLDLETAVSSLQNACSSLYLPPKGAPVDVKGGKGTGKEKGTPVDIRISDDVGNYLCGFMYYVGLLEMQKKTGNRDVVFFHVPPLDGEEEVRIGVRIAGELVKALVGVWEQRT